MVIKLLLFLSKSPCSFYSVMPVLGLDCVNKLAPLSSGFLLGSSVGDSGRRLGGRRKVLPLSYLLLYYLQCSARASYLGSSLIVTLQRYHEQLDNIGSSHRLLRSKSQLSEFPYEPRRNSKHTSVSSSQWYELQLLEGPTLSFQF